MQTFYIKSRQQSKQKIEEELSLEEIRSQTT